MLPRRPQEIVLRREHRVVQIVLEIVRRRWQVSRDFGRAPHWPRRWYHWRRRAARRCFRQRLRRGQGRGARRVVPTVWSYRGRRNEWISSRGYYTLCKDPEQRKRPKNILVFGIFFRTCVLFGDTSCATVIIILMIIVVAVQWRN